MSKRATNEQSMDLPLKNHLQKLYADYEKLQLEYGRLRKKFTEHHIKLKSNYHHVDHTFVTDNGNNTNNNNSNNTNKSVEELKQDLEKEKLLNNSLNAEISHLIKDIKTIEGRYADLLAIFNTRKNQVSNEARLKELENENKELKETLDFVTSENTVLKDLEERTFKEKLEWVEEKKKYEQVVIWSKHINDKLKATIVKNEKYAKQVDSFNKFLNFLLNFLSTKYQSLENDVIAENLKKSSNQEIEPKIDLIEKWLKSSQKNSDENSNLLNNNTEYCKIKISDLYKENNILKESNKCLTSEIAELKNILNKNNISSDEIDLKLENAKLKEKLRLKEEMLEKLNEKFSRNRSVLEENYKKSTEEIKALDNFIAIIIEKLNSLPSDLKTTPALKELIDIISESDDSNPEDK